MPQSSRRFRLSLLGLTTLLLLLHTTLAWLVNIEEALRIQRPAWNFFEPLMPATLYQAFLPFSADLSTISTLVPLLLLAFPCVMALRVLRFGDDAEARLRRIATIVKIDPLGLRKVLPRRLIDWLFGKLAVVVRQGTGEYAQQRRLAAAVAPDDDEAFALFE